jgi:hypothetical protein
MRELEDSIDSNDLSDWMGYDKAEPLPDSWTQTALLAKTIADPNRKKGTKPFKLTDFMPQPWKPRATVKDLADIWDCMFPADAE